MTLEIKGVFNQLNVPKVISKFNGKGANDNICEAEMFQLLVDSCDMKRHSAVINIVAN